MNWTAPSALVPFDDHPAPDAQGRTVFEREREAEFTGLLDADGNKIMRGPDAHAIGYVRFK